MFGRLGFPELLLILFIALLVFGPRKLPEMGKAVGESLFEFKNAVRKLARDHDDSNPAEEKAAAHSSR